MNERRNVKCFDKKKEVAGKEKPKRNGINQISEKRQKRIDAGEPFIKKVANSRKEAEKEYKKKSREFRKKHPVCEIKRPGICTGKTQGVQHKKGRDTIEDLLNEEEWLGACNPCNQWCAVHSKEAIELGFAKSKHKKELLNDK